MTGRFETEAALILDVTLVSESIRIASESALPSVVSTVDAAAAEEEEAWGVLAAR